MLDVHVVQHTRIDAKLKRKKKMKNANDFTIVTTIIDDCIPEYEDGVIFIMRNLSCDTCGDTTEFAPRFSGIDAWRCTDCWEINEGAQLSVNMTERLTELSAGTKVNWMLRDMPHNEDVKSWDDSHKYKYEVN
jgi:hypothetical protein